MASIKLTTKVELPPRPVSPLRYGDRILAIGSCFSQHMSQTLLELGHHIIANPMGILYNSLSIAQCLDRILEGRPFDEGELFEYGGLWHSPLHHGAYSAHTPAEALRRINTALDEASRLVGSLRWLFITLGTSWVYTDRATTQVVGNCHRRPESDFERRLVSPDEQALHLQPVLLKLMARSPELRVVLTISPIRHLRDGAHGNQLSKASLMLLAYQLEQAIGARLIYYPTYEVVMDELRDYRYYAEDLCHPAPITLSIIREGLLSWLLDANEVDTARGAERLVKRLQHRPLHLSPDARTAYRAELTEAVDAFAGAYPACNPRHWYALISALD